MNLWDYSKNGLRGMVFFLSLRFVEIKSETWLRSIGTMLMGIIGPLDLEEIVKEDPLDSNQMAQWPLASCANVRSFRIVGWESHLANTCYLKGFLTHDNVPVSLLI
jgi:hypothetical protein